MTTTHVESLDRRKIDEPDARVIAELLCKVWPKPGRTVETRVAEIVGGWKDYHGPEAEFPRTFLIRENGRAIAHAGGLGRTIGTTQGDIKIAALAGVCTDPDERGRGLGAAVVRAVFDLVDHGPYAHSLFQTSHKVRPFYEKLGACLVTNRIVNSLGEEPTKSPFWDEIVMRYPAVKPWPEGDIDLRGPGY
jgi:GNAT superfamily N-acetyltransferase